MGLTAGEVLDVVNIAYYVPALLVSVYVAHRHGFRRSNGWLYILVLDIVRIVGSSLGISAIQKKNSTLAEIAAILSSVGLSVLIHALAGLLRRINESIHKDHQTPPKWIDLIGIPLIIAIALAAWAGTEMGDGKPEDYSSGQSRFKIAGILFLVVVVLTAGLVILAFVKRHYLPAGEFRVVVAMGLVIPMLFIRIIYMLGIAFASQGSKTFNLLDPDVAVEAVMSTAPEFISVAILLVVGVLATPSSQVQKFGPPPTYEMLPGNKYETHDKTLRNMGQGPSWQPTMPAHTHDAQHYYDTTYERQI